MLVAVALLLFSLSSLQGQSRELQEYDLRSPEGRLLGFYSSALATTSLGVMPEPARGWEVHGGLELTYIPYLSREQRTAGFDKPESSNLSPVLPRPALAVLLPNGVALDIGWLPPVEVGGARANLLNIGVRRAVAIGEYTFAPRLSFVTGRVTGAITCFEELGRGTVEEQVYFAAVCHARGSEDHFEPRHISLELAASRHAPEGKLHPYLSAGVRHERTSFDIGVLRQNGERDLDHPVLRMDAIRGFGALGVQWGSAAPLRYAAEAFYTPGSLLTVRAAVVMRLR